MRGGELRNHAEVAPRVTESVAPTMRYDLVWSMCRRAQCMAEQVTPSIVRTSGGPCGESVLQRTGRRCGAFASSRNGSEVHQGLTLGPSGPPRNCPCVGRRFTRQGHEGGRAMPGALAGEREPVINRTYRIPTRDEEFGLKNYALQWVDGMARHNPSKRCMSHRWCKNLVTTVDTGFRAANIRDHPKPFVAEALWRMCDIGDWSLARPRPDCFRRGIGGRRE